MFVRCSNQLSYPAINVWRREEDSNPRPAAYIAIIYTASTRQCFNIYLHFPR